MRGLGIPTVVLVGLLFGSCGGDSSSPATTVPTSREATTIVASGSDAPSVPPATTEPESSTTTPPTSEPSTTTMATDPFLIPSGVIEDGHHVGYLVSDEGTSFSFDRAEIQSDGTWKNVNPKVRTLPVTAEANQLNGAAPGTPIALFVASQRVEWVIVEPNASTLRSILEPLEHAAVVESNGYWQAFEFDRCAKWPGRDPGDAPVNQHDVVARGDVFGCYLRTDPPADVLNVFYVIVLDESGTAWANGAGTNGSFFLPAMPSGLLCREYLTHPDFIASMGYHGPEDPARDSWWTDNDWAYASVLAYWFTDGRRADMDVDHDGVPCELLFDPASVARVWAGNQP